MSRFNADRLDAACLIQGTRIIIPGVFRSSKLLYIKSTRWLLALAFIMTAVCLPAADSGYCAFEIKVVTPSGTPAPRVAVGITVRGAALKEELTDAQGITRICDAPLEDVDVFAGFASCGLVVVKDIRPLWLLTRTVFILYDRITCSEFGPFPTSCHVLLRIKDASGRPIDGAELREDATRKGIEAGLSDSFGRLFRTVPNGGKLEGLIVKNGYQPAPAQESCEKNPDSPDREITVVLHQ